MTIHRLILEYQKSKDYVTRTFGLQVKLKTTLVCAAIGECEAKVVIVVDGQQVAVSRIDVINKKRNPRQAVQSL